MTVWSQTNSDQPAGERRAQDPVLDLLHDEGGERPGRGHQLAILAVAAPVGAPSLASCSSHVLPLTGRDKSLHQPGLPGPSSVSCSPSSLLIMITLCPSAALLLYWASLPGPQPLQ